MLTTYRPECDIAIAARLTTVHATSWLTRRYPPSKSVRSSHPGRRIFCRGIEPVRRGLPGSRAWQRQAVGNGTRSQWQTFWNGLEVNTGNHRPPRAGARATAGSIEIPSRSTYGFHIRGTPGFRFRWRAAAELWRAVCRPRDIIMFTFVQFVWNENSRAAWSPEAVANELGRVPDAQILFP
jgi:hypothetical protein